MSCSDCGRGLSEAEAGDCRVAKEAMMECVQLCIHSLEHTRSLVEMKDPCRGGGGVGAMEGETRRVGLNY